MVAIIFFRLECVSGKNNCDNSIPKSVNRPVRWVVRTTAFEILDTNEFCSPIANSNKQAIKSGDLITWKSVNNATEIRIQDSIKVGITKTFSLLLLRYFSIKKLEQKEPNKKDRIYNK